MSDPAAPQTWNPEQYLAFADQRLRPALDLLARVPLDGAARVTDLGCGAGNVTPYLAGRFPGCDIQGVDSSAEMLDRARAAHPDTARWVQADAARWRPDHPQDLIFSNAALHWLDDHEVLFGRLMASLSPGGVLAVQMPNQFDQPSHVLMRAVAAEGPWAQTLKPLLRPSPVAEPGRYFDWLKPFSNGIDIWQTQYVQTMQGDDPVLSWIASTALKPLLEALPATQVEPFREALATRLSAAYPRRADGVTLFPFTRLFVVAVRGDALAGGTA